MKAAVVYYSYDGNCARIAEWIQAETRADLVALETADEKRRTGLAKYAWGGAQVFMKKKPPLKPYHFDDASYDLVILGAPVWAGAPAPPLETFISETRLSGKRLAFFCCHRGGMGNALEKMRTLLPGNTFAGSIDFLNPLTADAEETKRKLVGWLKTLIAD
ncbi:MAG: flavodoxin [Treponema sp.]|nr:flavodoxin [Treponema sp.]